MSCWNRSAAAAAFAAAAAAARRRRGCAQLLEPGSQTRYASKCVILHPVASVTIKL